MVIQDGGWTLLEWDPVTGRSLWSCLEGNKRHYRIDYPVEQIVEANKAERAFSEQQGRFGDWNKVASIPHNVMQSAGLNDALAQHDDAFVRRFINDSDNSAWRTSRGKV